MALEIERKFLVKDEAYKDKSNYAFMQIIRQGYLNLDIDKTVRIRMVGSEAKLTIKGRNRGSVRTEFEYDIPESDGIEMLMMCGADFISKERYVIPTNDLIIEVDEFSCANDGLVVAEIEFAESDERKDLSEGELQHYLPDWIGKEVTDDNRYYNSSLILNPYNTWK